PACTTSSTTEYDAVVLVGGKEVAVTNPEKVFFPAPGITKGDLVQYYVDVAEPILNHVAHRPMQMKRHPNGVDGDFFYQKRVPNPHPEWLETVRIDYPSGNVADFPVVTDAAGLAWIANLGCIEMHTWHSRVPKIATITWVVKDRTGVFVDYGQNAFDRTIASAYSIRPMGDARASAPLRWDEVPDVDPAKYTLLTMRDRLATVGDLTEDIWAQRVSLLPLFKMLKLKEPVLDDRV